MKNRIELYKWINANYVMRVESPVKTLVSANTLSRFIPDLQSKIELFERLYEMEGYRYTYWNRKSLRIKFLPK